MDKTYTAHIIDTDNLSFSKQQMPESSLPKNFKDYCDNNGEVYLKRFTEDGKRKLRQVTPEMYSFLIKKSGNEDIVLNSSNIFLSTIYDIASKYYDELKTTILNIDCNTPASVVQDIVPLLASTAHISHTFLNTDESKCSQHEQIALSFLSLFEDIDISKFFFKGKKTLTIDSEFYVERISYYLSAISREMLPRSLSNIPINGYISSSDSDFVVVACHAYADIFINPKLIDEQAVNFDPLTEIECLKTIDQLIFPMAQIIFKFLTDIVEVYKKQPN